jgi:drug/metabolite transporter (DMT)-like permease
MPVRPALVSSVLLIAVLGVSFSGPLVRLSAAPPLAIAVWRLAFSLGIIAVPLAVTGGWRQWRALDRSGVLLAALGGILLALHFWSWNASVGMTTIAASVVLVNLQPIVVGVLSVLWLREPPTRGQWLGIAIATVGAVLVVLPDLLRASDGMFAGRALWGDALAVGGAVTAAGYYVIGRRLRASLDLWPYVALVYGACFVTLLLLATLVGTPLGPFARRDYLIFAGLAIGPMLLGHTALNWALRHARAYQVNIVLLGEPIGATLLAAALPGIRERPTPLALLGGIVVLCGVLLAERRRPEG